MALSRDQALQELAKREANMNEYSKEDLSPCFAKQYVPGVFDPGETVSMEEAIAMMTEAKRTVASGGRKDDADKDRIELIPPEVIFALSRVLTFGAKKYDDRNWEKGMKWGRVFGAVMRHLWAWWGGRGPTSKSFLFGDLDAETKFSHLWHALCCVSFLVAYEERGVGEDDRPATAGRTTP